MKFAAIGWMVLEILCVEPIYPQYSGVLETCLALWYWFFEVLHSESVMASLRLLQSWDFLLKLYKLLPLISGKEIFVGIGRNTNEKGAIAVAEAFPEYFVVPIYMEKLQSLHLKSVCSMAGKQVMAMSTSKDGEEVLKVELYNSIGFLGVF